MGVLDLIIHGANLVAPAFFVSLIISLVTRRWMVSRLSLCKSFAINFIASGVALAAGLVYFGNDGKMWTYAAMCAASATVAALLAKRSRA